MSKNLPPMAGGQDIRVVPGPIRGGHCPPPREIVVVEARKVFDFCTQEDLLERCFFIPDLGPGAMVVECTITNVTCQEIMDREPLPNGEGRALVSIQVNLTLNLTIIPAPGQAAVMIQRNISFPKRVVLCAPLGTDVSCEVRGTCICTLQPPSPNGVEGEPNICCTIQLSITLTVTANVKLLVPTFGMVLPKECTVAPVLGVTVPEDCPEPVGRIVDRHC
ncbi:MAG: hypothetical protein ACOY93_10910 [Bacillota bacterium]